MDFPVSQPDVGLVGGVFVDENAVTGQPGSRIPATWGNAVTKELLNVLQEAGIEPDESDTGQVAAAILKMISEAGGMPRFTPYVWGGRGDAMPEGDTQSSGQQLLDLMYPDMRADVVATQFTCTEAEWQADPYKRVTHWSLGDGVSWMRPPDKNGVQPGNVGAFYGVGSNPAGALTGTAVTDAGRNLTGSFFGGAKNDYPTGVFYRVAMDAGSQQVNGVGYSEDLYGFDASRQWPVADAFRPRTWYGIWMIRMYGRVLNPGALDAPALNARIDLIDARVSVLEGRQKALGDGQTRTSGKGANVTYTNPPTGRAIEVEIIASTIAANGWVSMARNGEIVSTGHAPGSGSVVTARALILPGETWRASFAPSLISGALIRELS